MVWIISFAIIGFFLLMLDDVAEAFFGLMFGAMFGFLTAMVIGAFSADDPAYRTLPSVPLESLVDGSDTRGSFFLGSGTINDVAVYTWYEQSGDNAYVQRQADADAATIHFSTEPPHYTKTVRDYGNKPFFGTWKINISSGVDEYYTKYDFYVPQGTIKHNYVLDAE